MIDVDFELIEAYSKIAPKYTRLKRKPWKDFQQYITLIRQFYQLPHSGIMLDVGTGNCRNLLLFENQGWEYIATDISFELLSDSVSLLNNKISHINSDMRWLPLRDRCIDFALCIASLHHLRENKDVVRVLKNIKQVLKNNNYVIISCWRRWKKGTRKKMIRDLLVYPFKKILYRKWRHGDIYLSWLGDNGKIIAKRYYHLFTKREITKVVVKSGFKIVNFAKLGGVEGDDNFFLLLEKT
ncbi:class I SAM-dependent methyltransferase [Candidatus Heimdallarchaeota archaeon]|nr:MAG: class I SAM-dependent methyltransferase [Candidatus Heimdallarchaeota archaeon]